MRPPSPYKEGIRMPGISVLGRNVDLKRAIGKTKARSQMCRIGTDDGRIVEVEIPVLKGCAAHDLWCSAWVLDAENQMQDETSGMWFQLLGERSTIPICLITETKIKNLTKLINDIFHESWIMDLIQAGRDAAKDKARAWLYTIFGAPILLAALLFGIAIIKR